METEALRLLAERVEKASGPDRELDVAIAERLRLTTQNEFLDHVYIRAGTPWAHAAKKYTAYLDAAMSLVPEGYQWTLEECSAWVRWLDNDDPSGVGEAQAQAETTALALCAAALRARATQPTAGD